MSKLKAVYTQGRAKTLLVRDGGLLGNGFLGSSEGGGFSPSKLKDLNQVSDGLDMVLAIESGAMEHFLCPVISLPDFHFVGFKSIICWNRADGKTVTIDRPIPLASSLGILAIFLEWYFHQLEDYHSIWSRSQVTSLPIFINERVALDGIDSPTPQMIVDLSGYSIVVGLPYCTRKRHRDSLIREVRRWSETGLNVILEVDSTDRLDLELLHSLPILGVKIGSHVVEGMMISDSRRVIGSSFIEANRHLGLEVIVEGIDNAERLDVFRDHSVDAILGTYVGNPMTHDELACLIHCGIITAD